MRILIVEDDPEVRDFIKEVLAKPRSIIDTAATCVVARAHLEANRYDLVTLDHHLPDGLGLDFARFIQTHFHRTRVIMITNDAQRRQFIEQAQQNRVEKVFTKPFDISALRTQVYCAGHAGDSPFPSCQTSSWQ